MADHSGHRQRLRKKFREGNLEDHEILELLLCALIPRVNTNGIAHDLIDRFGSLKGVFCASEEALSEIYGIGPNTAFSLAVISECIRRCIKEKPKKVRLLDSFSGIKKYLIAFFHGVDEEQTYLLLFNNMKRMTYSKRVAKGNGASANINVRDMVGIAVKHNAVSAAVAHNHPNGRITPSAEDIKATYIMKNSFETVGVTFVDHFVVQGDNCYAILAGKQE